MIDLPEVDQITVISADEALEEFKTITGIESVVKYISDNPLPTVLIVRPAEIQAGPSEFEQLVDTLRKFESVEAVEADFEWIRRLYSIVGLANAVFVVVSILLVVAAILLICNTTRLSVSSRLNEILVIDQIGGTKAFIRRPFVYIAVLQSLMAVLLSATIIEGVRISLEPHITQLAELYNSPFRLVGLPWQNWLNRHTAGMRNQLGCIQNHCSYLLEATLCNKFCALPLKNFADVLICPNTEKIRKEAVSTLLCRVLKCGINKA